MGKAARWFRNILGKKDQTGNKQDHTKQKQDQLPAPPPTNAKRWSFGKSSRDSAEAAAAAAAAGGNAAIARAAEAAWHRSAAAYGETDREREQSKHAIAVAAATAAAADAAVAAAQAAVAVVRLTSKGRAAAAPVLTTVTAAAVRIQTAFRGFLAKKALRALKALVKLQALVRGYLVRRQTAATLHSMQALIRAQAAARAQRAAAAVLPHQLHHHYPPLIRPRFSLQERYADVDTRTEHGAAAYGGSRRMSASVESSSYGYDRSPKIVEVDPGRPKSRTSSSRRASAPPLADASGGSGEDWSGNSVSSPLPSCYNFAAGPPRIAVPTSRNFPDHDWCGAPEKARPATAQSTPRYVACAPPTPTKSVAGGGGYSPSLNGSGKGYMSSTQSSEAKARSQSTPKQRPPEQVASARKRVPLSEVVVVESSRASLTGGVAMHRASCTGGARTAQQHEAAFSFKAAVVGRMDRTLELAGENDRLAFLHRRW